MLLKCWRLLDLYHKLDLHKRPKSALPNATISWQTTRVGTMGVEFMHRNNPVSLAMANCGNVPYGPLTGSQLVFTQSIAWPVVSEIYDPVFGLYTPSIQYTNPLSLVPQ